MLRSRVFLSNCLLNTKIYFKYSLILLNQCHTKLHWSHNIIELNHSLWHFLIARTTLVVITRITLSFTSTRITLSFTGLSNKDIYYFYLITLYMDSCYYADLQNYDLGTVFTFSKIFHNIIASSRVCSSYRLQFISHYLLLGTYRWWYIWLSS